MKKKLSTVAVIFLMIAMMFTLVGCPKPDSGQNNSSGGGTSSTKQQEQAIDLSSTNSDGATVKMSVFYNNEYTMMRYQNAHESAVTGNKYKVNEYKPAWATLQDEDHLNFRIGDVTPTGKSSVSTAYQHWEMNDFNNVNILSGPVTSIVEQATKSGTFVNLEPYIREGYMPYLAKFLEENELVRNSVTSADGEIFYAPYFDGYDDIETMFILRQDWVAKLLDGDANYDTDVNLTTEYKGFYKEVNTTFTAMTADGTGTHEVTLSYANGQGIIDIQNSLSTKNGATLVKALKDYINAHYVSKGYIEKPSDLFCGQDACYNADEMVALLRCVKTNPKLLTGASSNVIYPFYPRGNDANRAAAILQLAQLWGVRGYDSRNGYFYVDNNGILADGRASNDMIEALGFIHQMYKEGLILQDYLKNNGKDEEYRKTVNTQNTGFMTYDYNQTTTVYNSLESNIQRGMNLTPVLFPVADWDNKATYLGTTAVNPTENGFAGYKVEGKVLYQYTESWRSIKTEAWTITSSTKNDLATFKKCIEIFDYMYSPEGQILMSYGPDAYLKTKDASVKLNSLRDNLGDDDYDAKLQALIEQKYETVDYYSRKVPAIHPDCLAELKDPMKGAGNYTDYYRYYVGATLPIGYVKEQGMEYQTVDAKGLVGLNYIVNAVEKGVLKHAQVNVGADGNKANSLVPTTFPLTDDQSGILAAQCLNLNLKFDNSSAAGYNEYHNYVQYGFNVNQGNITTLSPSALKDQVNNTWGGNVFYVTYLEAYLKMYKK